MALLDIQSLTMSFGGLKALDKVDLCVDAGEIVSVIGPNGAGKTTLFNVISGLYRPTGGRLLFKGENLAALPAYAITARGIARTFQNIRVFPNLTVLENVMVGRHSRTRSGLGSILLRLPRERAENARSRKIAEEWLEFFHLLAKKEEKASNLAYG